MVLGFDPVALRLGRYAVGWFGIFALLGVGAAIAVLLRQAAARGLPREPLLDATAWALPLGACGARLTYLVGSWGRSGTEPDVLWQLPLAGLSLWGGLAAGGLVAAVVLKSRGVSRRLVADAVAPGLAMGIALGRFGQLLEGVGQGTRTFLPWGTQYASRLSASPDFGVPRHPTQVYDGLVALALGLLVLASARFALAPGVRFWTFLALYAAARVVSGPVRLDPPLVLGLQAGQCLALVALSVALIHLVRSRIVEWLPDVLGRRPDVAGA